MHASLRFLHPLAVLLAVQGCDTIFGLERETPPQFENYDRCGAFLDDEPLRYANVINPSTAVDAEGNPLPPTPWSWDDARTACRARGMDLAVFNDAHELGMALEAPAWPYWMGQRSLGTSSETVDGCPAFEAPIATRLVAADVTACGVVAGPLEIAGASCDGKLPVEMEPNVVLSALCETPRPDHLDCLGLDPTTVEYVMSDAPMSYTAGNQFCGERGGHLVVFETHKEWLFVSQLIKTSLERPFWVGAQFESSTWKAVNGCYGTYAWTGGSPGAPANGSCVEAKVRVVDEAEPGLSGTVIDGVEPTACGETSFALCEID